MHIHMWVRNEHITKCVCTHGCALGLEKEPGVILSYSPPIPLRQGLSSLTLGLVSSQLG